MNIQIFQVDAFADRPFEGNPAAVCPLQAWPDDALLQNIAAENNLSETAFFVPTGKGFDLRWFTPVTEVKLCGHATLATAHVLFAHLDYAAPSLHFQTLSGELVVRRHQDQLQMDFPALTASPCGTPEALVESLGARPDMVLQADVYLAVFDNASIVEGMTPDFGRVAQLPARGVVVTAPGVEVDFVSRFFAPAIGVPEDPVTGSAHCVLAPYWARRLGKTRLKARQVSQRGGRVDCEVQGDRVLLSGKAVTVMEGVMRV